MNTNATVLVDKPGQPPANKMQYYTYTNGSVQSSLKMIPIKENTSRNIMKTNSQNEESMASRGENKIMGKAKY